MKVEQILYTRVGGSELGAGWQSRKSEHFDADAEKGCMYQFNRIVGSMLDKAKESPNCLYAKWNSGKRICIARATKIGDCFGRGNILAHAYAVSDSEYIPLLSKPAEFICINDFADEITEQPIVLDALPSSEDISLKEVCRKYSITSDKMKQLICLVLSSVLRRSSNATSQKSLRIVVDTKEDDLCCAAREIMTVIYSFMPCVMRLNTSFASYAHKQLEGMSVLFTNEKCGDYYFDIAAGEWKWPAEFMIPVSDMAKVFVENRSNPEFQRDIENYVLQTGNVYNVQWNDMLAAYLYASLKNNIEISINEDELFKALTAALKMPHSSVQEEYIAELVKYYVGIGWKIAPGHAEQIVARYSKFKDENLSDALDRYNFSNYVMDFNDQKFIGFCALQKSAPDAYERTIKKALEAESKGFLQKIGSDIAKSKETYAAFIDAVSGDVKSEMYNYMIKNMYLCEDGSGYMEFFNLNKRVSVLYGELHGIALRSYTDRLKKYYVDFVIPNTTVSFEFLTGIKRTFDYNYDVDLSDALMAAAVRTFEQMCKNGQSPEAYTKYRNTLYELGCSGEEIERRLKDGKRIFWDNFDLSLWDARDSYRTVESFEYPICQTVSKLETMVYNIQKGDAGDGVYSDVEKILSTDEYRKEVKINILKQLIEVVNSKVRLNVEDMVIKSLNPQDETVDTQSLGRAIADGGFHSSDILVSVLLVYVIRHCRPEQTSAMYETILSKESSGASRAANGFKTLCANHGISLMRAEKEIRKRTLRDFNTVAFMLMFAAITVGIGIGTIIGKSGINGYGGVFSAVINASAACVAAFAISIPALNIQKQTEDGLIRITSVVIYVLALVAFSMSVVMWKL